MLHDDLLIDAELCAAPCAELDALYHAGRIALGLANSEVVAADDPIEGLGGVFLRRGCRQKGNMTHPEFKDVSCFSL